jgi:hypothetical protein
MCGLTSKVTGDWRPGAAQRRTPAVVRVDRPVRPQRHFHVPHMNQVMIHTTRIQLPILQRRFPSSVYSSPVPTDQAMLVRRIRSDEDLCLSMSFKCAPTRRPRYPYAPPKTQTTTSKASRVVILRSNVGVDRRPGGMCAKRTEAPWRPRRMTC